ncbi:MAG: type II methionyl aminopeptidase [Candidatus Aenigmarchaeota archaeon]|nr:type II methionyl aminopeptidase [Candidatus Aenigmarchaeota archaeon]
MDKEAEEKYLLAGKIAAEVREESRSWLKVGKPLLELAEQIEGAIRSKGAEPAFPVNLSLNEISAHYTPPKNDETKIADKDMVKIDIGVHVDGYIADTAYTVSFNEEKQHIVEAVKEALDEAVKMCKPGAMVADISARIEDTIKKHNCNPVRNLTGHGLDRYTEHAEPEIPNVKNNSSYVLKEDQVLAIEPFATDGEGAVKDTETVFIFMIHERKPVRSVDARKIMNFASVFSGLPFAERWIPLPLFNTRMALRELSQRGAVYEYPVLKEKSGGKVAQYEHTVIVRDEPLITTK